MGIALFYITSSCITYLTACVLTNFLVRDMTANKELTKLIKGNPRENILRLFLMPILNILLVLVMAYMVYSYHQYTMGKTDYNIFDEEGEF
jgi:sorbitol-specific phosphotransferase system component IIC